MISQAMTTPRFKELDPVSDGSVRVSLSVAGGDESPGDRGSVNRPVVSDAAAYGQVRGSGVSAFR